MASFSGKVKVDEQELERVAEAAKGSIKAYRAQLSEMASLIKSTSSYWEGEGAEHYRSIFKTQKEEVENMLEVYKKYANQLLEQSGKARRARNEGQARVERLNSLEMC